MALVSARRSLRRRRRGSAAAAAMRAERASSTPRFDPTRDTVARRRRLWQLVGGRAERAGGRGRRTGQATQPAGEAKGVSSLHASTPPTRSHTLWPGCRDGLVRNGEPVEKKTHAAGKRKGQRARLTHPPPREDTSRASGASRSTPRRAAAPLRAPARPPLRGAPLATPPPCAPARPSKWLASPRRVAARRSRSRAHARARPPPRPRRAAARPPLRCAAPSCSCGPHRPRPRPRPRPHRAPPPPPPPPPRPAPASRSRASTGMRRRGGTCPAGTFGNSRPGSSQRGPPARRPPPGASSASRDGARRPPRPQP
mmetsp:Transcript_23162/g.75668  ORF Transcript_23162/g.75668 Transcript_23162/m.75668 type:complete len:312 (+) Transcript_23162:487-1422(+)